MTDSPSHEIEVLDPESHAYLLESDGEPPLTVASQPN